MVRVDRVVTRGGDGGQTSLGDGSRVGKDAPRIAVLGTVDEANAAIGLLRCAVADAPETNAMLARIQNDLFDVGADLCVPGPAGDRLRLTEVKVERLEAEITALNATLAPLTSFVLPGGTEAAARAHVARAAVRHAERDAVRLAAEEALNPVLLRYLNRLSDHLFVLARALNAKVANADAGDRDTGGDVLWVPGGG